MNISRTGMFAPIGIARRLPRQAAAASIFVAAIVTGAITSTPANAEKSRTPYVELQSQTCDHIDFCYAAFAPVPARHRLEIANVNCYAETNGDVDIVDSSDIFFVHTTKGLRAIAALPFERLQAGTRTLGAHMETFLPALPREQVSVHVSSPTALDWNLSCTVTGDLVRLK